MLILSSKDRCIGNVRNHLPRPGLNLLLLHNQPPSAPNDPQAYYNPYQPTPATVIVYVQVQIGIINSTSFMSFSSAISTSICKLWLRHFIMSDILYSHLTIRALPGWHHRLGCTILQTRRGCHLWSPREQWQSWRSTSNRIRQKFNPATASCPWLILKAQLTLIFIIFLMTVPYP